MAPVWLKTSMTGSGNGGETKSQLVARWMWSPGGFSCVALSKAGKQRMEKDARSGQLYDTIKMAEFFGARAILLENVLELVDKDPRHDLLTSADATAAEPGYVRVFTWRRTHSNCGGASQRWRVLPLWLQWSVALKLAPMVDTAVFCSAAPMATHLVPVGDVTDWCIAPGCLVRDASRGAADPQEALRVGVHRYGSREQAVVPGSRVVLRYERRVWVVDCRVCDRLSLF